MRHVLTMKSRSTDKALAYFQMGVPVLGEGL